MAIDRRIGAMMARNNRPDTADDIASRKRLTAALAQARAETAAKYPVLSADNIDEALKFQDTRIKELREEGKC